MDGKTHRLAGRIAGVAYSLARTRDQEEWFRVIVRAAAAGLGGDMGARLPDVFEPATAGPFHRDVLHSWSFGGLVFASAKSLLEAIERWAIGQADLAQKRLEAATDFWSSLGWAIARVILETVAGIAEGLIAGYLSHLALDATTPRGLPLVLAAERHVGRLLASG